MGSYAKALKIALLIIISLTALMFLIILCQESKALTIILLATAVVASIMLYKKRTKKRVKKVATGFNNPDVKYCILVLLSEVINTDGKQTYHELNNAYDIINKLYESALGKRAAIKRFLSFLEKRHNPKTYCDILNKHLKYSEKKQIISVLLKVAYSDGRNTARIDKIAEYLEIDNHNFMIIKNHFLSQKTNSYEFQNEEMSEDEIKAYTILGVNPKDSDETIKKAFEKLHKIYSFEPKFYKKNGEKQYEPNNHNANFSSLKDLYWAWEIIRIARKLDESTNNNSYKSYSSAEGNTEEADYKNCLLVLCAHVLKADGKQIVCELDKVKNTIRRYYKTEEEQKEALQKFKEILDNDEKQLTSDVFLTINGSLNLVAKTEFIMELLAIAYADDELNPSEDKTIRKIANQLNINKGKYKSIYAIFKKKYKEGQYKAGNKGKKSEKNTNNNSRNTNKSNESNKSKGSKDSNNKSNNSQSKSSFKVNEAYDILGVSSDISDAEIKKAYRALAIKHHPDIAANLGDEAIRQATETMKQINMAWDVVKDARGMK